MKDSPATRAYGEAEATADLATYLALRRSVVIQSIAGVAVAAAVLAYWAPLPALALGVGCLCGVANMFFTMLGGQRLVESRNVGIFVLSSFLRIGLFGIVAAAFALRGPVWSMGLYFVGLFLPLALYAAHAPRAFRREQP